MTESAHRKDSSFPLGGAGVPDLNIEPSASLPPSIKAVGQALHVEPQRTALKDKASAESVKRLKYVIAGIFALLLVVAAVALIAHGGFLVLPFLHFAMHTPHMVYATFGGMAAAAVAVYAFVQSHEIGKKIALLDELASNKSVLEVLSRYDETDYPNVIAVFERCPFASRQALAQFWQQFSNDQSESILNTLQNYRDIELGRLATNVQNFNYILEKCDAVNRGVLLQMFLYPEVNRMMTLFKKCPEAQRGMLLDRLRQENNLIQHFTQLQALSDPEIVLLMNMLERNENSQIPIASLIDQAKQGVRFDEIAATYPKSIREDLENLFDEYSDPMALIEVLEKCPEDQKGKLADLLLQQEHSKALIDRLRQEDVSGWKLE